MLQNLGSQLSNWLNTNKEWQQQKLSERDNNQHPGKIENQ